METWKVFKYHRKIKKPREEDFRADQCHLKGQQQRLPLLTPQVSEDGSGHDGEGQGHQDPHLRQRTRETLS